MRALEVKGFLIDRLDLLLFLTRLDLYSCRFIGEEGVLKHGTELVRVLLERVKTHVIVDIQLRF